MGPSASFWEQPTQGQRPTVGVTLTPSSPWERPESASAVPWGLGSSHAPERSLKEDSSPAILLPLGISPSLKKNIGQCL